MALRIRDVPAVVLLVMATMLTPAVGRSRGAPQEACDTLTPQHGGNSAQTGNAPYTVTFSPGTFTPGGSPVTVTLSAASGSQFKGFLLTTMYEGNQNARPGSFVAPPAGAKYQLTCTSRQVVTHIASDQKSSISIQWTPPATSGGNVRFRATFVQKYDTFWVDLRSSDLLMETTVPPNTSTSQPDSSASTVSPQATPSTAAPTTAAPAPSGQVRKDAGCGDSKGCYSDCKGDACTFLVTWTEGKSADTVHITMSGVVGAATGRYIALGLSEDSKMGSDSVVFCVNAPEGVFLSYNDGNFNQLNSNPKIGLSDIRVTFQDGVLTCTFMRVKSANTDSQNKRFALNKPYTLLFATGPGSTSGAQYHNDKVPLVSTKAASLVDFTADIGGSKDFPFIKAHGSLMITAWIFAASIGIVLARYFKDVWQDSAWCGQKIWFQIHRACMVTALLATVAAFIIIFIEVGGYSEIQGEGYKKAHPILGIIVTALTIINPTMALFRPHPGTPKRPIFNWCHWMVGTGAHILGVITIFFGVLLNKAGAPKYIIYILATYVGWQVLIQVLLEIVQCMGRNSAMTAERPNIFEALVCAHDTPESDMNLEDGMEAQLVNDRSEAYEMSSINGGEPSKPQSQKEATFAKRLLLFLHMLVIAGFAVALIVVLNIGEDN